MCCFSSTCVVFCDVWKHYLLCLVTQRAIVKTTVMTSRALKVCVSSFCLAIAHFLFVFLFQMRILSSQYVTGSVCLQIVDVYTCGVRMIVLRYSLGKESLLLSSARLKLRMQLWRSLISIHGRKATLEDGLWHMSLVEILSIAETYFQFLNLLLKSSVRYSVQCIMRCVWNDSVYIVSWTGSEPCNTPQCSHQLYIRIVTQFTNMESI